MSLKKNNFKNTYKTGLKNLPGAMYRLLYPNTGECYLCGKEGDTVCAACSAEMQRHEGVLCEKCGRKVASAGLCDACRKHPRPYEKGVIALFYQGGAQEAMKEYKFENKLPLSRFFAEEIYKKISSADWAADIITAVPMHPLKFIGKGYNPPALIAKKLSKMTGIPFDGKILERARYTKSMSLLKGIDRMEHASRNFAVKKTGFESKNILIVDDVSTTGATLDVCAGLLKARGAGSVYVAAACGDTFQI